MNRCSLGSVGNRKLSIQCPKCIALSVAENSISYCYSILCISKNKTTKAIVFIKSALLWNSLTPELLEINSDAAFKRHLSNHLSANINSTMVYSQVVKPKGTQPHPKVMAVENQKRTLNSTMMYSQVVKPKGMQPHPKVMAVENQKRTLNSTMMYSQVVKPKVCKSHGCRKPKRTLNSTMMYSQVVKPKGTQPHPKVMAVEN